MSDSPKAVFLSYASEDSAAARSIADALHANGVEVWFDQSELRGGDSWDRKLRKQIKECALFMPVISASTQARTEGYFRREWKLAVDRTHDIADDIPFLVPVVIDGTTDVEAKVPDKFREVQWTYLAKGEAGNGKGVTDLCARVRGLLGHQVTVAGVVDPGPASIPSTSSSQTRPATELAEIAGIPTVPDETLPRSATRIQRARPQARESAAAPRRNIGGVIVTAVVALGIGAGLTALWNRSHRAALTPVQPMQFTETLTARLTTTSTTTSLLAISADSKTFVYTGLNNLRNTQLYRRDIRQAGFQAIPGTEGALQPSFSPDGKWLAFVAGGELRRVAVMGGPAVPVSGTGAWVATTAGSGGRWLPDDTLIFASAATRRTGLARIPVGGGEPKVVTELTAGEVSHRFPEPLPDGTALLFTVWKNGVEDAQLALVSLKTGQRQMLNIRGTNPRYVPTGHIVFAREESIWAVPFDAGRLEVTGQPAFITGNVRVQAAGIGQFAISADGMLLYLTGENSTLRRLVWLNRDGIKQSNSGAEAIGLMHPDLSPDGRDVAYAAVKTEKDPNQDVWRHNFASGARTLLSSSKDADHRPSWSPDGSLVNFNSTRSEGIEIFVRRSDGTGNEEPLSPTTGGARAGEWSKDGRYYIYDKSQDIFFLERAADGNGWNPEPKAFIEGPAGEYVPKFSPNGRYVAYVSGESGRQEIYVKDFPGGTRRWTISNNSGTRLRWSRDGKELFYLEGDAMMAVSVNTDGEFSNSAPRRLFTYAGLRVGTLDNPSWDVSADGQRFLVIEEDGLDKPDTIQVVVNWFNDLNRLAPARK